MENGNNNNNISFDNMWTLNHSRFDWGNSNRSLYATATTTTADTTSTTCTPTTIHLEASADPALAMFPHSLNHHHWSLYAGDGSNMHPDPHLTRLKLGKRHYFEDYSAPINGVSIGVGLSSSSSAVLGTPASVPRCQVEDCHVALINAKDYHRRHKVCEMHSKAPKAVVLGLEQRFCQQCSRFHVVSEFDGMKRSCRRRLAGHNKRRRKSYQDYISTNSSQGSKHHSEARLVENLL